MGVLQYGPLHPEWQKSGLEVGGEENQIDDINPEQIKKNSEQEETIKVSVVIPSYNSENYIFDCLKSLTGQETDFRYEIIVVDSSEQNVLENIKKDFPQVVGIH
ncbi:MAG: glycosyltransferase family 2 protein, partial [Planctomycetota bacterium]